MGWVLLQLRGKLHYSLEIISGGDLLFNFEQLLTLGVLFRNFEFGLLAIHHSGHTRFVKLNNLLTEHLCLASFSREEVLDRIICITTTHFQCIDYLCL